jgi:hypothetical protein
MPYRGPGEKVVTTNSEDPTLAACRSFVGAVRGEHPVFADVHVGFRAGVACAVAHDAVQTEEKSPIPESKIKA